MHQRPLECKVFSVAETMLQIFEGIIYQRKRTA